MLELGFLNTDGEVTCRAGWNSSSLVMGKHVQDMSRSSSDGWFTWPSVTLTLQLQDEAY